MTRFRFEAVLPTDARRYYIERDCPAFLALTAQVLHLEKLETVEVWREGNCVYLHQVNRPSVGAWVPQGAAKHVSGTLEFHDLVQVRPELKAPPFVLHTTTQVPALGHAADIHCTVTIDDAGPGLTRQTLDGEVIITVALLGRVVEHIVEASLKNTYERLPEVVQRWEDVRREVLRQPGGARRLLAGRPAELNNAAWLPQQVHAMAQTAVPGRTPSDQRPQQQPTMTEGMAHAVQEQVQPQQQVQPQSSAAAVAPPMTFELRSSVAEGEITRSKLRFGPSRDAHNAWTKFCAMVTAREPALSEKKLQQLAAPSQQLHVVRPAAFTVVRRHSGKQAGAASWRRRLQQVLRLCFPWRGGQ